MGYTESHKSIECDYLRQIEIKKEIAQTFPIRAHARIDSHKLLCLKKFKRLEKNKHKQTSKPTKNINKQKTFQKYKDYGRVVYIFVTDQMSVAGTLASC